MADDAGAHEIVIIKRISGSEEGHHGGAWKIAFADFMTAMMALFLVLWLISANDKTKAVVSKYFNPVQLVDSTPQPPGLNDAKSGAPSTPEKSKKTAADPNQKPTPAAAEAEHAAEAAQEAKAKESELFKDPYAVLAELSAKNSTQPVEKPNQAPTQGNQGGSGAVGVRSGEAYRDPFEPLGITTDTPPDPMQPKPINTPTEAPPPRIAQKSGSSSTGDGRPAGASGEAAPTTELQAKAGRQPKPDPEAKSEPSLRAEAQAKTDPQARAAALKAKIAAAMAQNAGPGQSAAEPALDVRHTDEGLLISLTDDADFSMFGLGSAEPAPKLVTLMEKIGRLMKTEKGRVIVRGFTDNRPFRSDTYDNWRLSSARAHMAHYMLTRGGVDEARFERIEGFADRRPKNLKDPAGPENRRIEILIRDGAA